MMCVVVFVLGLLNISNIVYFSSEEYSGGYQNTFDILTWIQGSAWCPDEMRFNVTKAKHTSEGWEATNDKMTRHDCTFDMQIGLTDLCGTILFTIFIFAMGKYQSQLAEKLDESVQTTQDYSVVVQDPGDDDRDPDKWKVFFEEIVDQTCSDLLGKEDVLAVSIAVKNGDLMELLVKRKVLLKHLNVMGWTLEEDPDFCEKSYRDALINGDELDFSEDICGHPKPGTCKAIMQALGYMQDVGYHCDALNKLNVKIKDVAKKLISNGGAKVARVFVTFNHEAAQRGCLESLAVGTIFTAMDTRPPECFNSLAGKDRMTVSGKTFGDNVLEVTQAPEPSDIIWNNLDITRFSLNPFKRSLFRQQVICTFLAFLIVFLMFFCILGINSYENGKYATYSGFFISFCNVALPMIMKAINSHEEHPTETSQGSSLLFKLVLARWSVSVLFIYILAKWETTFDEENIKAIFSVLLCDAFLNPFIRFCDVSGMIQRYISAPMAKTQTGMNELLKGGDWLIAERFSDMTKTLMICFFYSSIAPMGYFVTFIALLHNYWVDKYLLLRIWQIPPNIDAKIVSTTRMHLAIIVITHCVVTLHYYAGWPFDKAGEKVDVLSQSLGGTGVDGVTYYKEVDKNLWNHGKFIWFSVPEWLETGERQADITRIYQVFTIIMVVLVCLGYFGNQIKDFFRVLFLGYAPDGSEIAKHPCPENNPYFVSGKEDQEIEATCVDIKGYIPQMKHPGLGFPQLAIQLPDISEAMQRPESVTGDNSWFPRSMVSWKENPRLKTLNIHNEFQPVTYDSNNVYNDVILKDFDKDLLFSICRAYKEIHPIGVSVSRRQLEHGIRPSRLDVEEATTSTNDSIQLNPLSSASS